MYYLFIFICKNRKEDGCFKKYVPFVINIYSILMKIIANFYNFSVIIYFTKIVIRVHSIA